MTVSAFRTLASAVLDEYLERHPETATQLGDHRFDDRLDDRSTAALDEETRWVGRRLRDLESLGEVTGDDAVIRGPADQVDAAILTNVLELRRFELEDLASHTWDPLVANPGTAVYSLLARDFAPLGDRLRSVAGRLASVPAALESSRRSLGAMPAVHVETAIGQFTGTRTLLATELERALGDEPALRAEVEGVRDLAVAAIDEHLTWLRARVDSADRDLVTVHDDPVEIIVMPEIHRGVAVAYCDPPGPLESSSLPTYFAVSPTPADWSEERAASFFREYNAHMLANLTVHEAMPGHVLQLAHNSRYSSPVAVRKALWSGSFVEGWAVYAEELMVDSGYRADVGLADALRMQQLKMALRMTINAILDARVHAHGMTEDEAMRLMMGRGHQEDGEAAGKWRRALLSSAQLSTYYVGYVEVRDVARDLAAAWPDASVRERHDAMLAHGSPPPRHLRTLLGL